MMSCTKALGSASCQQRGLHPLVLCRSGMGSPRFGRSTVRAAAAATAAPSGYDAWEGKLPQWESTHKPLTPKSPQDASILASKVSAAATTYVPKHAVPSPETGVPDSFDFMDNIPELPSSLHGRLELVAKVMVQGIIGDPTLEPTKIDYTTTDIAAALQVAGVIKDGKKGRKAYIALVACETERTMTWSRLQGLMCHWAVSKAQGAEWQLPPRGFTTVPDSTSDAGGAWQSKFEVHPLVGPEVTNEKMFTLAMSLPLEGSLEDGGMVFVLKSGISGANTKWLKDAKTGKDIFLDLQALKTIS